MAGPAPGSQLQKQSPQVPPGMVRRHQLRLEAPGDPAAPALGRGLAAPAHRAEVAGSATEAPRGCSRFQ